MYIVKEKASDSIMMFNEKPKLSETNGKDWYVPNANMTFNTNSRGIDYGYDVDEDCIFINKEDLPYNKPIEVELYSDKEIYNLIEDVVEYCKKFGITETTTDNCFESLFTKTMNR